MEEHGLRAFENRVQMTVLGPKRFGMVGDSRQIHSEELHNLYASPSKIRIIKLIKMWLAGHVARMWVEKEFV
jgi:hypothetical protein